jgi:hypothetical protein
VKKAARLSTHTFFPSLVTALTFACNLLPFALSASRMLVSVSVILAHALLVAEYSG